MTNDGVNDKYILADDGKTPIPEPDLLKWGAWLEKTPHRVVKQDRVGPYFVSTVFLGLDHRFHGSGPPILWESMIFGEPSYEGINLRRYESYEKATAGHEEMLERVRTAVNS